MAVTEGNTPDDGMEEDQQPPTRIHHHIFVNGGLDRDEMEALWRRPRCKGQSPGDQIAEPILSIYSQVSMTMDCAVYWRTIS